MHRKRLAGHEYFIQDNSSGRDANLLENMVSRAAVVNPVVAQQLHLFIGRAITWQQFLSPRNLLRVLASSIAYGFKKEQQVGHEAPSA
jgi:hypothetical protein